MRIRRAPGIYIALRDVPEPDIGLLLRGTIKLQTNVCFVAVTAADEKEHVLDRDEVIALSCFAADEWSTLGDAMARYKLDEPVVSGLIDRGLLIAVETDEYGPDAPAASAAGWNRYAYLYHRKSHWNAPVHGPDAQRDNRHVSMFDRGALFDKLLEQYGPPPPEFYSVRPDGDAMPLPMPASSGSLIDSLRRRETVRSFNPDKALSVNQLSALLYYTFGCHGTMQLANDLVVLKKCSPSGGALHPIEAYPLIVNVDGIPSGVYHYSVEHHGLEILASMRNAQARALIPDVTAGQDWFNTAHCLVIMTARFDRSFWKYRRNSKAYKVLFLDAGHLSQTFYLLCADMGLGSFFTAAINDAFIEERLDLSADREGPIGVLGCGIPSDDTSLRLGYSPYLPPRD